MLKVSLHQTALRVLISTYWNVNTVFEFTPPSATAVLISTYWNVNSSYER